MKLREEFHRSIDTLDEKSLQLAFDYVQGLLTLTVQAPKLPEVPSLEEIVRLTSTSKSNWAEDVIASREERL